MPARNDQPFCAWCGRVTDTVYWVVFAPPDALGGARRQVCQECRDKLIKLLDQHQPVPTPEPRRRGRPVGARRVNPI